MSKLNQLKFEEYNKNEYLINQRDAEAHFRTMSKFPNSIGYDRKSNGFLVIHKQHSPSGLESEIPACVILKKLGYRVELLNEHPNIASLDVRINDVAFEMKRFSEGKDFLAGILKHFRKTYHKIDKIVLHIDKRVEIVSIKRTLRLASTKYPTIKTVVLIYNKTAIELDKEMIKTGSYWIEKNEVSCPEHLTSTM